nr:restriction endonuclease subunit S [Streptococcus ruminantium]
MRSVEWGEFRIGDLFEIKPTKSYKVTNADLFDENGKIPVVTNSSANNGVTGYTNRPYTEDGNIITYSDTTTSEGIFYQPDKFVGYSHIQGLYPKVDFESWTRNTLLFFTSAFRNVSKGKFSYGNKFNRKIASDMMVKLPTNNSGIDFDFMESFIAELEAERIAELSAYLKVSGLDNYELSIEERNALRAYDSMEWGEYRLEDLFGKSTRGKRLKSLDRISGKLPFVTAGEANTGISAYIGNDVKIFQANTTTIDMFGSAKYRNYNYGADDHIAVVHTENLSKFASLFITATIERASHTGKFSYDRNFYAKDADELVIALPKDGIGNIDYTFMENYASALQKLVIKDVVQYTDKRIEATKTVVAEHQKEESE